MRVRLLPNHVYLVGNSILELLLQISATVLIFAKIIDRAANGLERKVGEAAHGFAILGSALLNDTLLRVSRRGCVLINSTIASVVLARVTIVDVHVLHTHGK